MKRLLLIFLLLLLTGCSLVRNPVDVKAQYLDQIKEWQQRQKKEGWTISLVDEIVRETRWRASYVPDALGTDYWDTFRESYNKGFRGDCEDIAVAIIGTLKHLGYPHKAMVRIVTTITPADHAIAVIEMPDGEMREYNSVVSTALDVLFYRRVLDFDELEIN
jgi:hypothetical protein